MSKARRVCIVGFAGGFDRVPFSESGWEIWGFNQLYRYFWPSKKHPFTRWFELHTPDYFVNDAYGNKAAEGWKDIAAELDLLSRGSAAIAALARKSKVVTMQAKNGKWKRGPDAEVYDTVLRQRRANVPTDEPWRTIPVYLPKRHNLVPAAAVYPRAKVEALTPHGAYHAGSFDWMVALAILEGFTHIRITGVNFANGGEPISARPCLEYWCGIAEGRGITVEIVGGDCFRIFHLTRSDTQYGFAPWRLIEDAK